MPESSRPRPRSEKLPAVDFPGSLIAMSWQGYIQSDPKILAGKPVVKGTRLAVDFLLGLLGAGWTAEQLLENYPTLTMEALRAVFEFAAESLKDESVYALHLRSA